MQTQIYLNREFPPNQKNIIGTWKNANAEEVFTFQENGGLVVNKDMPELGITCGNALYSISSSNMIFVEQRDNSVNFEIEVDQNELTIFFMGHKYWELTKQQLHIKRYS